MIVLNSYGSAVMQSNLDFPIWAAKHNIKNPVIKGHKSEPVGETKIFDELIAQGFTVKKSPFDICFGKEPAKCYYDYIKREGGPEAEEAYKVEQFLYQYIYIANMVGIDFANKWIDDYKDDKYHQKEYVRGINNKPKLAYCFLKTSQGQCRMDCPYFNCGCQITSVEEQASRDLLEKYEPIKRKIRS